MNGFRDFPIAAKALAVFSGRACLTVFWSAVTSLIFLPGTQLLTRVNLPLFQSGRWWLAQNRGKRRQVEDGLYAKFGGLYVRNDMRGRYLYPAGRWSQPTRDSRNGYRFGHRDADVPHHSVCHPPAK
ncbi:MAG: hypothetical protein NVSMB6_28660 [Burkholderiaceae bacterium]